MESPGQASGMGRGSPADGSLQDFPFLSIRTIMSVHGVMPRVDIYNASGSLFESVRMFYLKPIGPSLILMGMVIPMWLPSICPRISSLQTTPATWASTVGGTVTAIPWSGTTMAMEQQMSPSTTSPPTSGLSKGCPGDNLGAFGWGGDESVPVPGDYDGDGMIDRAFYHWPTNRWFVEGAGGSFTAYDFGWGGADCHTYCRGL